MTYSTNYIKGKSIPMSITHTALMTAQRFANHQPTKAKKQRVYFNTLAVYTVNYYLQMMSIPTDLKASDSWNPAIRLCVDVADLMLIGLGHIECRPVDPASLQKDTHLYIPAEVSDERIGLIFVELDLQRCKATLLGFSKTVPFNSELPISQLQTMDNFLGYLEHLRSQSVKQSPVHMSQWAADVFAAGWQPVEHILDTAKAAHELGFRGTRIKRAKPIDLGGPFIAQLVVLIVELAPGTTLEKEITVEVQPTNTQAYLPEQFQVMILDEAGLSVMEAQARSANKNIQLRFGGAPGERFGIRLALGDVSAVEDFVI